MARLSHPNIVTAFDAGEDKGIRFLAMEYVEGRNLASLVAERGPLAVATAVGYTIQAARGLEYAHWHGMVHRDAKPVIPPRVDYSLTDLGREAAEQVRALALWTDVRMAAIEKAREEYDAAKA